MSVVSEINPTEGTSREYANMAVCFAACTGLQTPAGEKRVGDLQVGDFVMAFDGHKAQVRWIGMRNVTRDELRENPKLMPVRITSGALGDGLPLRDLVVSPQHRVRVNSRIAARMFDEPSALVSAKFLTELPGIYVDTGTDSVQYYHILLDSHEILIANGAPAESLYLGEQALKSMSQESVHEIHTLFPMVADPCFQAHSAHLILPVKKQKQLVHRHHKNEKPLVRHGTV